MNAVISWLSDATIQRLGWTLVHTLWQGVVIAAALAVLLRLMRTAPAITRYAAACAAMSAMVPAAAFTFNQVRVTPTAPAASTSSLPVAIGPIAADGPLTTITSSAPEGPARPLPPRRVQPPATIRILGYIVTGWVVGVTLLSLWHVGGWVWLRRMRRGVRLSAWSPMTNQLTERLGLRRAVALIETMRIDVPAVIGVLRPVILIPAGVFTGLSPQQVEAILAHELAHVRRHDYLVNLIQSAVETLLFYHPATWWISGQIRQERENCCDDIAADVCGDRGTYAAALAALEERRGVRADVALAATSGNLLARVRRVLNLPPAAVSRRSRIRSLAAAALALSAATLPLVVVAQQQQSDAKSVTSATTAPSPDLAASPKNFVKIVIGQDSLSYNGKAIDVAGVRKMFETMSESQRRGTVLEIAAASPDVTVERFFSASAQMSRIVQDLRLAYLSETGIMTGGSSAATTRPSAEAGPVPAAPAAVQVEPQKQYFLAGWIARPGAYTVASGQGVSVKQAIAAAGGLSTSAPPGDVTVTVIRRDPQGLESNPLANATVAALFDGSEKDIALHPGDVVQVSGPPNGEYYLGGRVSRGGVYSLTARKITVKQAIVAAGGLEKGLEDAYICIRRREFGGKETAPVWNVRFDDILAGKAADVFLKPNDIVQVSEKPVDRPQETSAPATQPRSDAAEKPAIISLPFLLQRKLQLEEQIAQLSASYGPEHPSRRNTQQMLDRVNSGIAAARAAAADLSPEAIAQNDPTMRQYLKDLDNMTFKLQQLSRTVGVKNAVYLQYASQVDDQKRRIATYAETYRKHFYGVTATHLAPP